MSNEYWIADETASPPSSVWETGLPERRVQERPSRATVLVVEDSDDDFELVAAGLSSVAGISFELEQATRLSQALDRLAAGGIDLVLLDLSLPDSSGPETFLKTHAAAPQVPIIVLTGLHDEELGIQAVQKGAEDYLIKGAGASPLVRSMRYAMARHYVRARLEHTLQELQTSEANLRTVIDGNADGLLILDPQGLVLFANLAAEELWIRKGLALLDEPVSFPVPGQGASQIELPDESGKLRTIDLRVAAIQWRGQPARLVSLRDVTHLKEVEDFRATLQAARDVQQGLLPQSAPHLSGFDISGFTKAASTAGGDFFDYLTLPHDQWGLIVADVSGDMRGAPTPWGSRPVTSVSRSVSS